MSGKASVFCDRMSHHRPRQPLQLVAVTIIQLAKNSVRIRVFSCLVGRFRFWFVDTTARGGDNNGGRSDCSIDAPYTNEPIELRWPPCQFVHIATSS